MLRPASDPVLIYGAAIAPGDGWESDRTWMPARIAATFRLMAGRHQPTKARRLSLREPIVARTAVGS